MIPEPLLRTLESMLNRNIGMSTPAQEHARELDGRRVVIRSSQLDINLSFEFSDDVAELSDRDPEGADCVIEGSPLTLLRLAGDDAQAAFRDGSASMRGDVKAGKSFQQLLRFAKPDWEEELSRVVGDVAAHQLVRGVRGLFAWGQQSSETMAQSAAGYLQGRGGGLPGPEEAQQFMDDVDELRELADRVEARLRKLERGSGS